MSEIEVKKRKGQRGKGVKPALVYRSLRLPAEVLAFYNEYPNPSAQMREVLEDYAYMVTTERAEGERLRKIELRRTENGSDT